MDFELFTEGGLTSKGKKRISESSESSHKIVEDDGSSSSSMSPSLSSPPYKRTEYGLPRTIRTMLPSSILVVAVILSLLYVAWEDFADFFGVTAPLNLAFDGDEDAEDEEFGRLVN